eukprot:GCRY01000740.1.p1 GENE.GCRY01000740.1~~GCRY01000740.1.p1  ORF type:complete len:442 (+),score=122.71 GCRY01000740.1:109-1434(+)
MSDTEAAEEKTFKELGVCPVLCETLDSLGWTKPMPIQKESLPYAFEKRDLIGIAETGSGKTGAFALPILQDLLDHPQGLFAVVLAPTRELALQINDTFNALGSIMGVKTVTIVGGVDMVTQAIALSKKPHIIVSTPGRLVDHVKNTKGFNLRSVKYLVMDEADRLLNMEFEEEINQLLKVLPRERTTYLFSATMTSKVAKLQRASLSNPVKVEVSSKYQTVNTLIQQYVFIPEKFKDTYFVYILNEFVGSSVIVFTMTKKTTQRLHFLLDNLGFDSVPLHGNLSQEKRVAALNTFKSGAKSILLATDVAARGLDIPSVDLVINYDIPTHSKEYIHRVGRTARAGRSGRAINMVTQYDVEIFMKIEKLMGKKLDAWPCEKDDVLLLQSRVMEAQRIAATQLREEDVRGKGGGRKKRRENLMMLEQGQAEDTGATRKAKRARR